MSIIQETLTDFIADGEMNEDDVEFAARSLAFQAVGGADRGSRDQSSMNKRNVGVNRKNAGSSAITSLPNATLVKRVTFVGDEENLNKP